MLKVLKQKKKVQLSDNDDLWMKYKYKQIVEALTGISEEFQRFVETNQTAKSQRNNGGELDLKQMSEIVKAMPMYNELLSKYTLHMNLVEQALMTFKSGELNELGEIEQALATGLDSAGKTVTNQKLIAMIAGKFAMQKIGVKDKLRLIMITCIALEIAEKERKALTQSLSPEDQATLTKLVWLGVNPQKISSSKGKANNKIGNVPDKVKSSKKQVAFDLCRYTPQIESIATMVVSNQIDKNQFDSLFVPDKYDGSMAQRTKLTAGQIMNQNKGAKSKTGWNENMDDKHQPKFIFFIIGGLSYPEIRCLKEFESSNAYINVLLGSTLIIKPSDYMEGISKMVTTTEYNELKSKEGVSLDIKS